MARRNRRRQPKARRLPQVTLVVHGITFHSKLEALYYEQVIGAGLPTPTTQHLVVFDRKWQFDFAWPKYRLAVEIDGGIWLQGGKGQRSGGHAHPLAIIRDNDKRNAARALGWIVMQFETNAVNTGQALDRTVEIFCQAKRRPT